MKGEMKNGVVVSETIMRELLTAKTKITDVLFWMEANKSSLEHVGLYDELDRIVHAQGYEGDTECLS